MQIENANKKHVAGNASIVSSLMYKISNWNSKVFKMVFTKAIYIKYKMR